MADIKSTKDYSIFKQVYGNRVIKKGHVANLTKSIIKKNLLANNPIIVNEKMQVIDGQHRLEVAKNNNLAIYYTIADKTTIEDIQMINSSSRLWTGHDYLHAYIAMGIKGYEKVDEYVKNGVMLSNAIRILNPHAGWTNFKNGKFKIENEEASDLFVEGYLKLKPFVETRVFNDREFVSALNKLSNKISIEELIGFIESQAEKIEYSATERDYLRQFESIINFHKRSNYTRLF